MRLFLAITLPDEVKSACAEIQELLRVADSPITWSPPEQLHITLRFFEDFPEKQLEWLVASTQEAVSSKKSFFCSLGQLGAFPSWARPRVVWLGVADGKSDVCALERELNRKLPTIASSNRSYSFEPHATLGRVRRGQSKVALSLGATEGSLRALQHRRWPVRGLTLFESQVYSYGAEHTPLFTFDLEAA